MKRAGRREGGWQEEKARIMRQTHKGRLNWNRLSCCAAAAAEAFPINPAWSRSWRDFCQSIRMKCCNTGWPYKPSPTRPLPLHGLRLWHPVLIWSYVRADVTRERETRLNLVPALAVGHLKGIGEATGNQGGSAGRGERGVGWVRADTRAQA